MGAAGCRRADRDCDDRQCPRDGRSSTALYFGGSDIEGLCSDASPQRADSKNLPRRSNYLAKRISGNNRLLRRTFRPWSVRPLAIDRSRSDPFFFLCRLQPTATRHMVSGSGHRTDAEWIRNMGECKLRSPWQTVTWTVACLSCGPGIYRAIAREKELFSAFLVLGKFTKVLSGIDAGRIPFENYGFTSMRGILPNQ